MKTMTIRHVSAELASALEAEKRRRGLSLNRTVLSLMQEALGISNGRGRSNGLRRLAGSWSEDEFRRFEAAMAPFEEIEEDLWNSLIPETPARPHLSAASPTGTRCAARRS